MDKLTAKELQAATTYRVEKDLAKGFDIYRVSKRVLDEEVEFYHVTLKEGAEPFCDCPGFVRQKFDRNKHKHVRVVRDYISRGSPTWCDYKFKGAGKDTKIRFLHAFNPEESQ